nr:hypothetical protein [Tanacetum cinerariifolium]
MVVNPVAVVVSNVLEPEIDDQILFAFMELDLVFNPVDVDCNNLILKDIAAKANLGCDLKGMLGSTIYKAWKAFVPKFPSLISVKAREDDQRMLYGEYGRLETRHERCMVVEGSPLNHKDDKEVFVHK